VIVAARFGWSSVSDVPMDWVQFSRARQLLAEERVGRRLRQVEAAEDNDFAASRAALSRR
jgi:hypothetical protein